MRRRLGKDGRPLLRQNDPIPTEPIRPKAKPALRSGFRSEAQMCAFLVRHLEDLEPGLELYQDVRVGTEYPCVIRAGRRCSRVDILAQDKSGRLVVIECKKLFGSTTALGQLLGYMGWVQEHLCVKGEVVRGVLVVGRATPMLLYAVRFVGAHISVFECAGPRQLTRLTPAAG